MSYFSLELKLEVFVTTYSHTDRHINTLMFFMFLGLDPIDSLFEICQRNELQVGLTLDEINQEGCLDTLNQWFGLTEETIAQYFAAIDINNDNFITKKESQIAIQTLERKGGGGGGCDNPCSKDCRKECPGKLHTRRCRCEDTGKCENFYQGKWQTC